MATNWTLAQAKKVITEGTDLAAITDIGRRFPLTALAIAKIGDNEGATTIINALPEHITVRKIESVLKDGIADSGANDDDDDDAEDAERDEKPAKKNAKAKAETDDTADDEDPITLYKKCKKAGLKVAPKKSAKYYKDALKKAQEAENEADGDADDWDDADDEEEKPAKKTGKAAAKKSKAKTEPEPEPEDEDDDEDEWDI